MKKISEVFSSVEPEWDYYCQNSGREFDIERYFNASQRRLSESLSCISVAGADRGVLCKKCLKLHREDLIYELWRRGRRLRGSQKCFILSLDALISITLSSYSYALSLSSTHICNVRWPFQQVHLIVGTQLWKLSLSVSTPTWTDSWSCQQAACFFLLSFLLLKNFVNRRIEFCLRHWSLFSCLSQ